MKKVIYIFGGMIALSLGALGIMLPVLPTTPFLILAMYCFAKGSDKLNRWFIGTELYKKYLDEYVQKKAMTLRQKLAVQIFAGLMMAISFMLIDRWIVRSILIIAFLAHNYVFIFKIRTLKPDAPTKQIAP